MRLIFLAYVSNSSAHRKFLLYNVIISTVTLMLPNLLHQIRERNIPQQVKSLDTVHNVLSHHSFFRTVNQLWTITQHHIFLRILQKLLLVGKKKSITFILICRVFWTLSRYQTHQKRQNALGTRLNYTGLSVRIKEFLKCLTSVVCVFSL